MIITAVEPTKSGRLALYVDGALAGKVRPSVWEDSGLAIGSEVDRDIISGLLQEERQAKARRKALSLLSMRDYSAHKLTESLTRKTDGQAARAVVEDMARLGYVDDAAYARRLAQVYYEEKQLALRRVRQELLKRGLARRHIEEAVAFIDPEDEPQRAAALIEKHFKLSEKLDESAIRRIAAFLERRGYGASAISYALRTAALVWEDETD